MRFAFVWRAWWLKRQFREVADSGHPDWIEPDETYEEYQDRCRQDAQRQQIAKGIRKGKP